MSEGLESERAPEFLIIAAEDSGPRNRLTRPSLVVDRPSKEEDRSVKYCHLCSRRFREEGDKVICASCIECVCKRQCSRNVVVDSYMGKANAMIPICSNCFAEKTYQMLERLVINTGGLSAEGIFRVSGHQSVIKSMFEKLQRGDYSMNVLSPHDAAGLLKLWVSSTHGPLIPLEYHLQMREIAKGLKTPFPAKRKLKVHALVDLIKLIPIANQIILKGIIKLCRRLSSNIHVKHTKMTLESLATIFSPTVIQWECDNSYVSALEHASMSNVVTLTLFQKL